METSRVNVMDGDVTWYVRTRKHSGPGSVKMHKHIIKEQPITKREPRRKGAKEQEIQETAPSGPQPQAREIS